MVGDYLATILRCGGLGEERANPTGRNDNGYQTRPSGLLLADKPNLHFLPRRISDLFVKNNHTMMPTVSEALR
jgi:hypothetical protein